MGIWPLPKANPPQAPRSIDSQMQKKPPGSLGPGCGKGYSWTKLDKASNGFAETWIARIIYENWDDEQTIMLQRVEVRVKWLVIYIY